MPQSIGSCCAHRSFISVLYTELPSGAPLTSDALKALGISADLAVHFVRSGWLTRFACRCGLLHAKGGVTHIAVGAPLILRLGPIFLPHCGFQWQSAPFSQLFENFRGRYARARVVDCHLK
jgi:hypothetical protein